MSCVILSPFACHSEAEPKNLKGCRGQALRQAQDRLRRRISERSKILHRACPETLRGVYPEQDQILRGVYTERSECAQDGNNVQKVLVKLS